MTVKLTTTNLERQATAGPLPALSVLALRSWTATPRPHTPSLEETKKEKRHMTQ